MIRKIHKIQGYNVDLMTFEEAIDFVLEKMKKKKGIQIVTVNPEMIELAHNNNQFSKILKNAELVIPDGVGIKWALKLQGIEQEQIPGIDFAKELINSCNVFGYTVAFIGAKEYVIQKTVKRLKTEFEGLNVSYFHNGFFTEQKEEEIISNLVESQPDFVLVALGAPKQEFFIDKCRKYLPETTFIGVGGSFDVWAGEVERAPEFFRIAGCEWLYRTYKQPSRLKRIYKTLPMFLFKAIVEAITK